MTHLEIIPLKQPISVALRIPGSKSYTNRALILAALTKGSVTLQNPLYSEDTAAMITCLQTLGIEIEIKANELTLHGDIFSIANKNYKLFAKDSGTTVRFLLALLCIVPGVKRLEGNKRLNERPIKDLVDSLRELGAHIDYCEQEGQLPVQISSSSLSKKSVHLKSDQSSQFCSALLMIAPYLPQGLTIHLTSPLISKTYVDMTIGCMQDWGAAVFTEKEKNYFIPAQPGYQKAHYKIEGDFSSAGYFFAAAALTNSTLFLENLNPFSAQPDRKFLTILEKMGSIVSYENTHIRIQGKQICALEIDMEDCPDQVMTLAVLSAFCEGTTKISGVRSLRLKETERVIALKTELKKMGIQTEDTYDTLTIYGGLPKAASIDTYNDHRMAMAFAIAGLRIPKIIIRHPEVVNKTFPTFWDHLKSL
jgi:3-phosphoshikimate 1-carboxyvinyltransferase